MLSLIITIIVIIILAAVAFGNSTRTIEEANFSDYANDMGEVRTFFEKTSVQMRGSEILKNMTMRDEQIYNFVAKGGKTIEDFLKPLEIPVYTIIEEDAEIGIKLPYTKVESGTGHVIPIKYAATKKGKIFSWPPYDYKQGFYITDDDTVDDKLQTVISVGGETFTIIIDETDGSLLPTTETNYLPIGGVIGEGNQNGNIENPSESPEIITKYKITFNPNGGTGIMEDIEVAENTNYQLPSCEYVPATNYTFDTWQVNGVNMAVGENITITSNVTINAIWKAQTIMKLGDLVAQGKVKRGTVIKYTPDVKSIKLGNDETGTTNEEQTTDLSAEWRVLYTDGGGALITTYAPACSIKLYKETGFLKGPDALNKLCKALYSGMGLTARCLRIEDIEKATGIDTDAEIKAKYPEYKVKYAYYNYYARLDEVTVPDGYKGVKHTLSCVNEYSEPRFYVYDSGGTNKGNYRTPTKTDPVCVTGTYYEYNLNLLNVMSGATSLLASQYVECYETMIDIGLRYIEGDRVRGGYIRNSYGTLVSSPSSGSGVRPAIELSSSQLIDTANGEFSIYAN